MYGLNTTVFYGFMYSRELLIDIYIYIALYDIGFGYFGYFGLSLYIVSLSLYLSLYISLSISLFLSLYTIST